jgi:hypothetical protein
MIHKNPADRSVRIMLSGEEKRFLRTQPITPVVLTGGGRSGWLPGKYACSDGVVLVMAFVN